jgi:hypothetical protein
MNFIVIIFMISTMTVFLSIGNNMIFPGYPQTIENDSKEKAFNQSNLTLFNDSRD